PSRFDHVYTSGRLKGLSHPRLGRWSYPPYVSPFPGLGRPMRKQKKWLWIGVAVAILAATPAAIWLSLTHQPSYYRAMVRRSREQREGKARKFVAQGLQLRNDICNEPTWEAVFSDEEVNAWLAEDLVSHFADTLPPEVHEPRVLFELDRIVL